MHFDNMLIKDNQLKENNTNKAGRENYYRDHCSNYFLKLTLI